MKIVTILMMLSSVLMVGCRESRDVSTPEKALIGQWRWAQKEVETNWYFYESGIYTFVWPEGMGCEDKTTAKFIVLTQNSENRTITVDLLNKAEAFIDDIPSRLGNRLVGKYSEDYSQLEGYLIMINNPDYTGYVNTYGGYKNFKWKYIEEVTEPGLEPGLKLHQSKPTKYPTPDSREFHPWRGIVDMGQNFPPDK